MLRLDARSLVLLVGAAGSGKSTWAGRWFAPEQIVSSDGLRGVVGQTSHDQRASTDAFEILDRIVEMRLRRRLLTVVDSTGLDPDHRLRLRRMATDAGAPAVAVVMDTSPAETRARNRSRPRPVPERAVARQIRAVREVRDRLADEGWDVARPDDVRVVPAAFVTAPDDARRQQEDPVSLSFGLSLPRFAWTDGPTSSGGPRSDGAAGLTGTTDGAPPTVRSRLTEVARAAERLGFTSLHLMDHVVQIPAFGPVWEDMLESTTTLGFLAGVTERIRLGALVHGITHRSVTLLGKAVATLDVLSGGRATCGLGAAWYGREYDLYGWDFPPLDDRYRTLDDALRLLPLLWGPGTPPFEGQTLSVPQAICYPRPLQRPRPEILVGGQGPRRTLRLVAEHADACNLRGDEQAVTVALGHLRRHCRDVDRDPDSIRVTHLGTVLVGRDGPDVATQVERLRPDDQAPLTYAGAVNAATVEDHVGRFRRLADLGVDQAIVSFPGPATTVDDLERFAPVIDAFRT